MPRLSLCFLFLLSSVYLFPQDSVTIRLPDSVSSIETFLAFRDSIADTPEGGAAVFVQAMLLFEKDPKLGHAALVVALDRSHLMKDIHGYRGYTYSASTRNYVGRYLLNRPYIARSYVLGTSPADSYTLPAERELEISRNKYSAVSDSKVKVFVASTGADSPRPITLQENNRGIWKALEFSSMFVGVRPPSEQIDDDL